MRFKAVPRQVSRRSFLKSASALALAVTGCTHLSSRPKRILVNDVQSRLNPTHVDRIISVESLPQLQRSIQQAVNRGDAVSTCGGRHAMGAQQFLTNGILLDTTRLVRVLNFDADNGTIDVEAGLQWPALLNYLLRKQSDPNRVWTFAQKQTGANRFCIGGALVGMVSVSPRRSGKWVRAGRPDS
jgi:FAD/FMN-containing dehydrogenase